MKNRENALPNNQPSKGKSNYLQLWKLSSEADLLSEPGLNLEYSS
jgi:hypothetical protein